jgi:hypothetical protein
VTAIDQDTGEAHAVALQPAFRKQLDDSKSNSHRCGSGTMCGYGPIQHVEGHQPWQASCSQRTAARFPPAEGS